MGIRDRDRRPARSNDSRLPKKRILILCEGLVTEPTYLNGFKNWVKNPLVDVEVSNVHGCPLTLVTEARDRKVESRKLAKRHRDANIAYNAVACVYDVDTHPNLAVAKSMAKANDILLGISNPSIELWILLHFRDDPGPKTTDELISLLSPYLPGYHKSVDFEKCKTGYENAVKRAKAMELRSSGINPSTTVYKVTELIRLTSH